MANTGIIVSPAPFEKEAIEKLIPEHKELIRAKFEPRVHTYTDTQLFDYLSVIIDELMVHTQSNHMGNELMLSTLAHGAVNELKNFSGKFTLSDARIALNEGYRGSFGDIIGLSQVNFARCFRSFDKWDKRLEANKAFGKAIDEPKTTEAPVSDMFKFDKERVCKIFDEYVKFKEPGNKLDLISPMQGLSSYIYAYLIELKGEFRTKELKIELYQKAKKDYETKLKRQGIHKLPSNLIDSALSDIKTNISVTNLAKRYCVEDFFTHLITNNINLKDKL